MKIISTILLCFLCAACSTTKATDADWTAVVVPYDQPPSECLKAPAPAPRLSLKEHDGDSSAREYRKLKNSYVDLSQDYKACQVWAKGQRK